MNKEKATKEKSTKYFVGTLTQEGFSLKEMSGEEVPEEIKRRKIRDENIKTLSCNGEVEDE